MLPKYSRLAQEFKGLKEETPKPKKYNHVPPKNQRAKISEYDSFILDKLPTMHKTIDDWGTKDILFYFRYYAERRGFRYIISNYAKEMSVIKRIRGNFSNAEICAMIEFLYDSEQTYIRRDNLTPSILSTSWVNSIFADTMLWVNDEYHPTTKKTREWKEDSSTEDVSIGEWK